MAFILTRTLSAQRFTSLDTGAFHGIFLSSRKLVSSSAAIASPMKI